MRNNISISLLSGLLCLTSGMFGATIGFSPTSQSVAPGGSVSVDITISGLAANTVLGAFDLTVLYDGAVVGNPSIAFQGALGTPANELTGVVSSVGAVHVSETSLESSAALANFQSAPPFSLFRITFTALNSGTSPLSFALSPRDLSDGLGNLLPSAGLTFNTGSIVVTTGTPEPASGFLSLAGLGLAMAVLRFKRNRWVM